MSAMKDVYVIIPAHNEEHYIDKVLRKTTKYTNNIIVVDDGSIDSTHKIAEPYTPFVLKHRVNMGKGAALKTGCEFAFNYLKASSVVLMDSDDQHNPKELTLFFNELAKKSSLVFGARDIDENMPIVKTMANRLASYLVQKLFGAYIPDIPSGYKAFTKESYEKIEWQSTGYGVELEIAARAAKLRVPFSVVKVSTIYHDHVRGMTIIDALRTTYKLIIWRINI